MIPKTFYDGCPWCGVQLSAIRDRHYTVTSDPSGLCERYAHNECYQQANKKETPMKIVAGCYPSGQVFRENSFTDLEVFAGWFMMRETRCDNGQIFKTWLYRDCTVAGSQWEVVEPPTASLPLELIERRHRALLNECSQH